MPPCLHQASAIVRLFSLSCAHLTPLTNSAKVSSPSPRKHHPHPAPSSGYYLPPCMSLNPPLPHHYRCPVFKPPHHVPNTQSGRSAWCMQRAAPQSSGPKTYPAVMPTGKVRSIHLGSRSHDGQSIRWARAHAGLHSVWPIAPLPWKPQTGNYRSEAGVQKQERTSLHCA